MRSHADEAALRNHNLLKVAGVTNISSTSISKTSLAQVFEFSPHFDINLRSVESLRVSGKADNPGSDDSRVGLGEGSRVPVGDDEGDFDFIFNFGLGVREGLRVPVGNDGDDFDFGVGLEEDLRVPVGNDGAAFEFRLSKSSRVSGKADNPGSDDSRVGLGEGSRVPVGDDEGGFDFDFIFNFGLGVREGLRVPVGDDGDDFDFDFGLGLGEDLRV